MTAQNNAPAAPAAGNTVAEIDNTAAQLPQTQDHTKAMAEAQQAPAAKV